MVDPAENELGRDLRSFGEICSSGAFGPGFEELFDGVDTGILEFLTVGVADAFDHVECCHFLKDEVVEVRIDTLVVALTAGKGKQKLRGYLPLGAGSRRGWCVRNVRVTFGKRFRSWGLKVCR